MPVKIHEVCIKYSLIKCKSSMLLFDQEICCLRNNNRWNLKNHPFNNWSKISFAHYVYYRNAASQNIDASIGNDWKWLSSSSFICNIRKHHSIRAIRISQIVGNIDQCLSMCCDFLDAQNMRLLILTLKCTTFVKLFRWCRTISVNIC